MKKLLISMLLMASCFGIANAQLLVDENGKIGIGIDTNLTPNSQLSINSVGSSTASA